MSEPCTFKALHALTHNAKVQMLLKRLGVELVTWFNQQSQQLLWQMW